MNSYFLWIRKLPHLIKRGEYMKYTIGDVVKFKLDSGEVHEGNIQYVEKSSYEEIYYINSFNRWAYKIPGNKIISQITNLPKNQ